MKDDHLVKLIHWLIDEVLSASGDGDAILINKTYERDVLKDSVLEAMSTHRVNDHWKLTECEEYLYIGQGQEGLSVYYNVDPHRHIPTWSQCVVTL
jgi:hypothetical protein